MAAARMVDHADGALVEFDDLLGDGQAETGASGVGGAAGVEAGETLEDAGAFADGDAGAFVVDGDLDAGSGSPASQADGAAGGAVPYGVVEEVGEDLGEQGGVGFEVQAGGDVAVDGDVVAGQAGFAGGLAAEGAEVERLGLDRAGAGVEPGQVEELGDQAAEALRLGESGAERLPVGRGDAVHDVLQDGLKTGDRRTEFVAHVGDQFAALPVDFGEVGGHGVEGTGELAHLVAGGGGDAQAVPALGDGLGGGGHLAERLGHAPGHELHHDHRKDDGDPDAQVARQVRAQTELVDHEGRHHGQYDHQPQLDLDPPEEVQRSHQRPRLRLMVGWTSPGRRKFGRITGGPARSRCRAPS
ncbi:hypothetical protein Aph01nite_45210 [Acrocarpospora phusangensis]|uniref:Uncharacterized protein n=1 Tax=Acrocarpospora phusangensis TaxID=1070424 RepID=A0A919QE04_9ACTN|nr:hypothetical protein Aph01nite_45210 [Acrocarpospora phusangensis]